MRRSGILELKITSILDQKHQLIGNKKLKRKLTTFVVRIKWKEEGQIVILG